jgi:RimJ/RimL family protein N-acetyltransferase
MAEPSKNLTFSSERLVLKEISAEDIPEIHRLHSVPEVDEFNTLGIPEHLEVTEKLMLPQIQARGQHPRNQYTWKILLKKTDQMIGLAGYTLSNDKFRLGEIYYKLHPDHWGKGYATEVAKRLVLLGFEHFHLHKVEAGVATGNVRSIRVLEKIGMTREGLRRKILPIRGKWVDNYHYAIVEDDPRDY